MYPVDSASPAYPGLDKKLAVFLEFSGFPKPVHLFLPIKIGIFERNYLMKS